MNKPSSDITKTATTPTAIPAIAAVGLPSELVAAVAVDSILAVDKVGASEDFELLAEEVIETLDADGSLAAAVLDAEVDLGVDSLLAVLEARSANSFKIAVSVLCHKTGMPS